MPIFKPRRRKRTPTPSPRKPPRIPKPKGGIKGRQRHRRFPRPPAPTVEVQPQPNQPAIFINLTRQSACLLRLAFPPTQELDTMPAVVRRGRIYSFDTTNWTANVLIEGSTAEVVLPVAEYIPSNMLANGDQVAVMLFDPLNPDVGVVLGPFGAVQGVLTLVGLNVGPNASGAPAGQVLVSGTEFPFIGRRRTNTGSAAPGVNLIRSRDNLGLDDAVQADDDLMSIGAFGYDGSAGRMAAQILAEVDGTPGSSDMPGRLIFKTTPDGSITAAERIRIDAAGLTTYQGPIFLDNPADGWILFDEQTTAPADPNSQSQMRVYMRDDKFIIQYNASGTVRYKYLDLTGTGVTWVHTTTPP